MFNMQERIELVKLIKVLFHEAGMMLPAFKDVATPSVNFKETFGTVSLVDTPLILAVTTDSKCVTVTNTTTRKVTVLNASTELRDKLIKKMLEFTECKRYN